MALTKTELDKAANEYYDDIYKFCFSRAKSIDAAEDITQEAFLALARKAKQLNNVNLRAWLYTAADLSMKEYVRKQENKQKNEVPLTDIEDPAAAVPGEQAPDAETFEALLSKTQIKILAVLNEEERKVFIKRYLEKKTVSIICEETGRTPNDVYVISHRIKKKAKKLITNADLTVCVLLFKLGLF